MPLRRLANRLPPDPVIAMVVMCVVTPLLPVGDAISKVLTGALTPLEVTWARTVVMAIVLALVVLGALRKGARGVLSRAAAASGALSAVLSLSLIAAFQKMQIATAISIFFVEPLLLTLLAVPLLGEKVGPRRYVAILVGMIGVLIILRPSFADMGAVVFLPLIAALAFALNMILVRRAARAVSPMRFQLGSAVFGSLFLSLAMIAVPGESALLSGAGLEPWVLPLVLVSGAFAALTFLLITIAFSLGEASVLAPFQYLEIFGASVVGYMFFRDTPDGWTVLGASIILGSGLYVFFRERRAGRG